MEFLIAKASETAPAQTIRIEQGPVKIVPDTKNLKIMLQKLSMESLLQVVLYLSPSLVLLGMYSYAKMRLSKTSKVSNGICNGFCWRCIT